jgi:hypothetical protein
MGGEVAIRDGQGGCRNNIPPGASGIATDPEILASGQPRGHTRPMFSVDEPTADAIRHALNESGELAAIIELRRHFPLIGDNAQARLCVRAIASWGPVAALKDVQARTKPRRPR